eukprot:6484728-Amphidinium_carterae.1
MKRGLGHKSICAQRAGSSAKLARSISAGPSKLKLLHKGWGMNSNLTLCNDQGNWSARHEEEGQSPHRRDKHAHSQSGVLTAQQSCLLTTQIVTAHQSPNNAWRLRGLVEPGNDTDTGRRGINTKGRLLEGDRGCFFCYRATQP